MFWKGEGGGLVRGRGFDVLSWVSLGWGVLSVVVWGGVWVFGFGLAG